MTIVELTRLADTHSRTLRHALNQQAEAMSPDERRTFFHIMHGKIAAIEADLPRILLTSEVSS